MDATTTLIALAAAFGGGLILNVMPCVLPVLTMKVFSVIEQQKDAPGVAKKHALVYSLGVILFFMALATAVIVFKLAGESLLWGQQWQHPIFVAILLLIIFTFGLNALGVFEIQMGMSGGDEKEGYTASLAHGFFAAVMATPCSAPGLGVALPFALHPDTGVWGALLVFFLVGAGLAFPFLLVSYVPALAKRLPRPGAWMETFKKIMGFTLMGAAVWLFGVFQYQLVRKVVPKELPEVYEAVAVGLDNVMWGLAFLLIVSFMVWAQQHWGGLEHSDKRRWGVRLTALGLTIASGFWLLDLSVEQLPKDVIAKYAGGGETVLVAGAKHQEHNPRKAGGKVNWVMFDQGKMDLALKRDQPVFLDFTAEWCMNCKANEKRVLNTEGVIKKLEETKILPMKVDFTDEDEEIEKWIEKLGRSGIPIYVVYFPDGTYDLMPEIITQDMVLSAFDKAAKRYPHDKFKAPGSVPPATKAAKAKTEDTTKDTTKDTTPAKDAVADGSNGSKTTPASAPSADAPKADAPKADAPAKAVAKQAAKSES